MSVLYLHGGMQKTGTSSIQRFLARNRKALQEQNTAYPDFGDIYHFDMVSDIRNAYWLSSLNLQTQSREDFDRAILRIGELSKEYSGIILSDEMLWRNKFINSDFWKLLKEGLAPYNITIRIVVYLRKQDEYIYSMWGQMVKSPQTGWNNAGTFEEFFEEGYGERTPLDFPKALRRIEQEIGRENIVLRVFEPEQLEGGSLTMDFCKAVGLSDDPDRYRLMKVQGNTSLKDSVLEAKRYLNRMPDFCTLDKKESSLLNRYLRRVQDEMAGEDLLQNRNAFSNEKRRAFMQKFEEGNEIIARQYFGREDGRLFYAEIPEEEGDRWDFTAEELAGVYAHIISDLLKDLNTEIEASDALKNELNALKKEAADGKAGNLKKKIRNRLGS